MSASNSDLATKASFLVGKIVAEHEAKITGAKYPKATFSFSITGKPGRKKLSCRANIPTVDATGCRVVYEPEAEAELVDPAQGVLL